MKSYTAEDLFRRSGLPADALTPGQILGCVAPEARPFVVAALARAGGARLWVVCEGVREQEDFASELAEWHPGTRIFPELPAMEDGAELLLDPETASERTEILTSLGESGFEAPLVLHRRQLDERVPNPKSLLEGAIDVTQGMRSDLCDLTERLERAGYERTPQVGLRGQYAMRGGILDIFSRQASRPIRMEFDDDEVVSLREFDPDSQISSGPIEATRILLSAAQAKELPLSALIGEKTRLVSVAEGLDLTNSIQLSSEGGEGEEFFALPFGSLAVGDLVLDEARSQNLFRQLEIWREEDWMVVLAAASEGESARFREFCSERGFDASWIGHLPLALSNGFVQAGARLAVLADAALFGRSALLRAGRIAARRHRAAVGRAATDFSEFEEGETVVHLEHGIGRYEGLVDSPDGEGEVLAIAYAADSRLYVPISQAWQVSRYAGLGRAAPELSELGGTRWQKAKDKAVASVFDYAARMLRVQAERETIAGHPFGADTHWQAEFESAFPFKETADQVRAIDEAKRDMETARPMDRLVCGDVGFGKTEVAIRALFKAVMDGKQAAFLAPTTILAQQHYQTLKERLSDYPVTVELLSRFRKASEQRKVVQGLAEGGVDIVVGTHRLVSPDVVFRDIGLVVVDEEQRFGVKHKDILKERFRQIDVLTLSATPIPRTLYMALVGARDMSLIETPPPNRQPVETIVCGYDERVMRDAILRELERGGQVYVLHNRVKTIGHLATRIRDLCPTARVAVGHGQMGEGELEPVMESFVAGQSDVLVSTTIIESGLDIPNANTIVIDRADLFGLADLYQLRGRVGRSGAKAYAYLMLPRDLMGAARRRVSAIKQYSQLGSGFKIAMRDLELRGAGNMLGTAQSGHILAVGFDLYCKLLRRAVDTVSNKTRFARAECTVRLDFLVTEEALWDGREAVRAPAFVPAAYVPDARARIACYRQLAEAEEQVRLEALRSEWRDRFGPLPPAVANVLALAGLAIAGSAARLISVEAKDAKLILSRKSGLIQIGGRFPRLTLPDPTSKLREIRAILDSLCND